MPILLWYLPYTMFSGACDLVLSEFELHTTGDEPEEFDEPPLREVANRPSDHAAARSWGMMA
jgi:hypothetical protein